MKTDFLKFSIRSSDIYAGGDKVRTDLILRTILSYCLMAIIGMFVIAYFSDWPHTAILTAVIAVAAGLSIFFLNVGWFRTASWLALTTFIAGVIYGAYIGDGLHDLSLISLPGILLIAAILLDRNLFIIFSVITICSPILISLLQYINLRPVWHPEEVLPELLVMILILTVTAIGIRILINHILTSYGRVQDSENKYRNFYTNIQDIYYEIDMNGRILEISHRAEELLGFPVRDLIGRSIQDFYALPANHPKFMEDIRSGKRLDNYEVQLKDRQENFKVVSINAALTVDSTGKPLKVVGSMRDISEKKQLEQQLFQAQKLESIGTLAGGVAHDFNNLLTVINGHCELALANLGDHDPLTASDIKAIKSAGERAANLTRQLLMFSKKQVTSPVVTNPNTIILNMQKMFNRLLGENIEIHYRLDQDIPLILTDPIQFEQILMNLMINARDALMHDRQREANRQIFVKTKRLQENDGARLAEITIRDTGAGMDPAVQERIFEPFFTTKDHGTGLGLSTVYGIIKQNNAKISVKSEIGAGSTFTILWPENRSRIDRDIDRHEDKRLKGTEHILLVEDDPAVRLFTSQALSHNGYTVTEAADGTAALEFYMNAPEPIDLLLTDMILPGINGLDLYRKLKEKQKGLKALFISGYANTEILEKLKPEERENFLHKPFGITDLLQYIRRVLGQEAESSRQDAVQSGQIGDEGLEMRD